MSKEKKRTFAFVEARRLHASRLLPNRKISPELEQSIKRDGIQQPIIARPSPYKRGTYEIIDGHLRRESVQDHQKVLVLIKHSVTDLDVFKISEATFKRNPRSTYERACFYCNWVRIVVTKYGSRGSQKKVATMASLSEAEVSHYLSISKLFERLLSHNIASETFNVLKNQGVNRLYALAKVEDESAMLEVAAKMAEDANMPLEELEDLIEEQTSPMQTLKELIEEDEQEQEDESIRMDALKKAALELEGTLNQTRKTLTVFKSKLVGNPRKFISTDVFKRIRRMLNALKRIEKEANRIIRSGKKASYSD